MILENYTLWIRNARLSFPHLLVAKPVNNGPPKFSANFILQDSAPEWAEAMQIIGQLATDKWADKAQGVLNMISQDKRLRCYGSGSEKISQTSGEVYDGYGDPGIVFISGSNDSQPDLRGADAQPIPPTGNANQLFVGGNYVDAVVRFWPQENEHGRAIRGQLVGVQYLREGEHFGNDEVDVGTVFQAVPGAPAPTAAAPGMPAAAPAAPAAAPAAPAAAPAPKPVPDFL